MCIFDHMTRYFIELSYDGTNYHGWQVQPNASSVQETIENALSTILQEKVSIVGAGRTDAGVHASYFVAHLDIEREDLDEQEDFVFKLNRFLPKDIAIHAISKVDKDMHARFSAIHRTYIYSIRKTKPLFNRSFCHYYYGNLNIDVMNEACEVLMEYTDFTSFSKLHTDVKTNDCSIMSAVWTEHDDGCDFEIKADRFLRNMVRSIVGTMMDVGTGKLSIDEFRAVIEVKDRGKAGTSAEAKGLFLVDIGY